MWRVGAGNPEVCPLKKGKRGREGRREREGRGRAQAREGPFVPASPALHSPAPRVCLQTADSRLLPQGPDWHFHAFCAALTPVTVTNLSSPPLPSDPFSCLLAEKKPLAAWVYKCFIDTTANWQKAPGWRVLRGRRPLPPEALQGTLEEASLKAPAPPLALLSLAQRAEASVGGSTRRGQDL